MAYLLLQKVIKELEDDSMIGSAESSLIHRGIPTLKPGIYRPASPQIKKRFEELGAWREATHGDWLSISEMIEIWNENISEDRLIQIKKNFLASKGNWTDDAGDLFQEHRLTLFAASETSYERIYLVWFESCEEPEVWVYDSNGEGRFKDLNDYLLKYLEDDLDVYDIPWKLGQIKD